MSLASRISQLSLRRSILLCLIVVFSLSLSACNLDAFRASASKVPQLVVSVLDDPKTFNYILSQESPNIFGRIYDGLLLENPISGQLEPALAESWQVSPDNLKLTFTLREGLKWSDGQPLTADDVLFTYNELILNEQIPSSIRDGLRIGDKGLLPSVRKLDDRRIEFVTPEPFSPLLRAVGTTTVLPKHVLEESVHTKASNGKLLFLSTWGTDTDPKKIISNGPYVLSRYEPAQRVVFQRNPYYWRKDEQGNQQPYIERYIWQIVPSSEAVLMQFRSGALDLVGAGPTSFQLLKKEEKRGKFTILNGGPAAGTTFMTFNLNQGQRNGKPLIDPIKSRWFNMVAFRQAVAYGIDRRTMITNIYRGLGEPQNSPISVQNPYYLSPKTGRLQTYEYNPEKAKALLTGAGFKYNNAGQLFDAEGHRVRFTLLTSTGGGPIFEAFMSQIKTNLQKIGMQVDVQLVSFNTMLDRFNNSIDWECTLLAFTDDSLDPNSGANVWRLDGRLHMFNQTPDPGAAPVEGQVFADWEKEIAQLYVEGARTFDESKRKEIYAQTQILAQEYLPFIHLINPLSLGAVRNKVKGVKFSAYGGAFWNLYELKLAD